jgi:hypothetical protein
MEHKTNPMPSGWRAWLGAALGLYSLLLLCTQPVAYVDSLNYAWQIVQHYHATLPAAQDHVWDFGHAAWRPMALAVWTPLRGLFNGWYPDDEALSAACAFIVLNALGGAAAIVFLFLTAARVTATAWAAGLTAIGYMSTAVVMNYVQTGTAYMTGAACQFAALYLLSGALQTGRLGRRGWAAGLLLGVSIAIWFPFVLAMPGFFCFALLWPEGRLAHVRARIPFAIRVAGGISAMVATVYAVVIVKAQITTFAGLVEWISHSRYGISPTMGILRMVAGIPRSFLWLGDDASNWKRILLGGGGVASLLTSGGMWKLLLVYAVLGLLIIRLWKLERGRALLVCLGATAVPVGIFAAFLFDPSALERYIQLYPVLFLAFACAMASTRMTWFGRGLLPLFFISMLAANTMAMARWNGYRGWENAVSRLKELDSRATPGDTILVMSFQDDAYKFTKARPFDPASRLRDQIYITIEPGSVQPLRWKELAAANVSAAWQRSGRVFVSLRLLAEKPAPEWNWIEGDDSRIRWSAVPAFFRRLELAQPFAGSDGFAELVRSPSNERLVREALGR